MNNNILKLDNKKIIVFLSLVGIIIGFTLNVYFVNGIGKFFFYIMKLIVINILSFVITIKLKNNHELEDSIHNISSYILLASILNFICSLFVISKILPTMFIFVSGIVCFWLIVSLCLEIVVQYNEKIKRDRIYLLNKKIGLMINPILKSIRDKITNG